MAPHILICGYGEQGKAVINAYGRTGAQFVHMAVVDACPERAFQALRRGHVSICGNSASLHSLRLAYAGVVDLVAVCVADDASAHVVRALKLLAPNTPVQVVVEKPFARMGAEAAGADHVLVRADIAGRLLAQSAMSGSTSQRAR